MSDSAESATKSASFLGALESASKFNVLLLAITFLLLVDNLFIVAGKPGVVPLATSDNLSINSSQLAIQVILIYVGFSFLLSIATPIFATTAQWICIQIQYSFTPWVEGLLFSNLEKPSSSYRESRESGMVSAWQLREYALIADDYFYVSLYEKSLESNAKKMSGEIRLQIYVGSCLLMWGWNMWLSAPTNMAISFVSSNWYGDSSFSWGILLVLGWLMLALIDRDRAEKLIFCPVVYRHFYPKSNLASLGMCESQKTQ